MQTDSRGHKYVEVENIRLTYIPKEDRTPDKEWAGSDVIRIQAYKAGEARSLHMGAEIPIKGAEDGFRLVAGLAQLFIKE